MSFCARCSEQSFILGSGGFPSGISTETAEELDIKKHQMKTGNRKLVISNFTSIPKNADTKKYKQLINQVEMYRRNGKSLCIVLAEFPCISDSRVEEIDNTLFYNGIGCQVLKTIPIRTDASWVEFMRSKHELRGKNKQLLFRQIINSPQSILSIQEYGGISLAEFVHSDNIELPKYDQFLKCIKTFLGQFSSCWQRKERIHGDLDGSSLLTLIKDHTVKKISVINKGYISKIIQKTPYLQLTFFDDFEILLFELNRQQIREKSEYYVFSQKLPLEVNLFVSFSIDSSVEKSDTKHLFMQYVQRQKTEGYMPYLGEDRALEVFSLCLECFGTKWFGTYDRMIYDNDEQITRGLLIQRIHHYYTEIYKRRRRGGVNMNCFVDTYAVSYHLYYYFEILTRKFKVHHGEDHETYQRLSHYKGTFAFALSQPMTGPLDKGTFYKPFCDWDAIIAIRSLPTELTPIPLWLMLFQTYVDERRLLQDCLTNLGILTKENAIKLCNIMTRRAPGPLYITSEEVNRFAGEWMHNHFDFDVRQAKQFFVDQTQLNKITFFLQYISTYVRAIRQ